MDESEYHSMAEHEENYWWHKGRRKIIETVAKKFITESKNNIADIGCGTGGNFEILSKFGTVDGLDMSESALEYCRKRNVYNELVLAKANELPKNKYNIVTAFDVLEHLDGDTVILHKWAAAIKPHGFVLLTVPAYQWLFGPHDRALQHKRRYTQSELVSKIRSTGFTPIYSSYFFCFTFPILCVSRLLSKLSTSSKQGASYQETPRALELFFLAFSNVESLLIKRGFRLPFGSSIVIIAKKN